MAHLGKYIQTLRQKQQLTQAQLEKQAKLKKGYISRLECGRIKKPAILHLEKIAKELKTPLENLLLFEGSGHSFQDLLKQSEQINQKLSFLKNDIQKLQQLLHLAENFTPSLAVTELDFNSPSRTISLPSSH